MIKSFSVENYKSFPNKVTIDFTANNYIKEKKESVVKIWKHSIVKNAIIYWQNAVWKTYLLKAMSLYFDFIKNSFSDVWNVIDFDFKTYWNNNNSILFEAEFVVWKKLYFEIKIFFFSKNKKAYYIIHLICNDIKPIKFSVEYILIIICNFFIKFTAFPFFY